MHQSNGSPKRLPVIEGLVILILVALVSLSLLPDVIDLHANSALTQDKAQLHRHRNWITLHKDAYGSYPSGSGHEFVLAAWTRGICEHTPENLSMFFVPGLRDSNRRYHELRKLPIEEVWKDLSATTSADTHYAGRSSSHKLIGGPNEAWMADDNEGGWCHREGVINVLLGNGSVTSLCVGLELREYGAVVERPFEVGPASPHPLLQQLEK